MQLRTESYISYAKAFNEESRKLEIKCGHASSEDLDVKQTVQKNQFSHGYHLEIELKEEFSVTLYYNLVCYVEDGNVQDCRDFFSTFNSKYLAPVLKKVTADTGEVILHANRNYAVTFEKLSSNSFAFKFILDAAFLHPAWNMVWGKHSTANEKQQAGTIYNCNFSLLFPGKDETFIPAMPLLYPSGCKAGFILTDHCDFDTAKKLHLFLYGNNNDGWLNKNLKITKGVFTLSSRSKDFDKNDSLEDDDYAALIETLYKDGSEIVPHALKSKGQLDKAAFEKALEIISTQFKPATWIDHGSYLKYCYSQGGKTNPDYKLVEALKKYNYTSLWSFHDVNIDAVNTLNIFSNKAYSNKVVWRKVGSYFFKGKFMIAAHHFRSIIHRNYQRNIFFDFLVYSMAQVKGSFVKWKTDKKKVAKEFGSFLRSLGSFRKRRVEDELPYSGEELLKYSEAVFLEERRPLAQYREGDLLMFSTFETTHIKDIYNKAALDKLIAEYGLHIGHTYILNDLPYLSNIFSVKNKQLHLSQEWIRFTETLSSYIREGKIWNPNMGELIQRLKSLLHIEFHWLSAAKFVINNNNPYDIPDFTFIIPASSHAVVICNNNPLHALSSDDHFHFFCIDLNASTKYFINEAN